ncbi:MAG: hypothetical protein HY444_10400 [Nitrospirae bacterium]|nr:hypothetical protein [Nitrospirota bacterium]
MTNSSPTLQLPPRSSLYFALAGGILNFLIHIVVLALVMLFSIMSGISVIPSKPGLFWIVPLSAFSAGLIVFPMFFSSFSDIAAKSIDSTERWPSRGALLGIFLGITVFFVETYFFAFLGEFVDSSGLGLALIFLAPIMIFVLAGYILAQWYFVLLAALIGALIGGGTEIVLRGFGLKRLLPNSDLEKS